jgi:hypothetical protein
VKRLGLAACVAFHLVVAGICGTVMLDIDEFRVIKEPYEMLGGDYTLGYLGAREYGRAVDCAARAYRLWWTYRPINSPLIPERDKRLFEAEEKRFGYVRPPSGEEPDPAALRARLVVPDPDRFYRHGAGAPLLTAWLRIPGLALVRLATARGADLLWYQFHLGYHPIFLLPRLQGLVAGLVCVVLVHRALRREVGPEAAWFGAALMAAFPTGVLFFPNLHYDALLAPFAFAAAALFVRGRHVAAGACFGLGFACKNSAVFLIPAAILFVAMEAVRLVRAEGTAGVRALIARRARGLAAFVLVGLACLTPFANPVTHLQEVLTPFVERPMDPRGENLRVGFTAGRTLTPLGAGAVRVERSEVVRVRHLVSYGLSLMIVLVGLPLLWYRVRAPLGLFAIAMMIVSFPYRAIFGDGLGYRALMFVPFFAALAPLALGRRALLAALALVAGLSLLFAVDPISANGMIYNLVDQRTLWQVLTGTPG